MKKKNKRKKLLLPILFILAVIITVTVLAVQYVDFNKIFNPGSDPQPAETPAKDEPIDQPDSPEGQEPVPSEDPAPTPAQEPENKAPQYEGNNPNINDNITGVITYMSVSNNTLIVRVSIDQYLNGGECNIILEQGGTAVFGSAARVVDSASTSTCEGFNVPIEGIDHGKYNVLINITSERKTGTIKGEATI